MKLVERKPRLSKFGNTVLLVAVLSLLAASSAVAAIFSLNIEQRAETTNPMEGDWELFLTQDRREIKGSVFARPLSLYLKIEGKRPVGSIWFPLMSEVGAGLKQAIDSKDILHGKQGLLDPSFDGKLLSFRVDSNGRGDLIEMILELSGENLIGLSIVKNLSSLILLGFNESVLDPILLSIISYYWSIHWCSWSSSQQSSYIPVHCLPQG